MSTRGIDSLGNRLYFDAPTVNGRDGKQLLLGLIMTLVEGTMKVPKPFASNVWKPQGTW
jgi:hypothetical protein